MIDEHLCVSIQIKIPGDPRGKVPEFLNYQDFVVISFPNSHYMFTLVFVKIL